MLFLLAQRGIVRRDARGGKKLGERRLVLVGGLAQIGGGHVEAEHVHGADQLRQPRRRPARAP